MARAKKSKPRLLTLEEQLAEHDREAPDAAGRDAYGESYRRQWMRQRVQLLDQIRHRDDKRAGDGTVEVMADDPEATRKAKRNATRCAQSEAFRHNRLDSMQREALTEMDRAYRMRASGIGPTRSSYGPRGGRGAGPESAALEQAWVKWCTGAVEERIMIPPVMDCIFEVMTLTEIERKHRMRRGQAFGQLVLALHLWAQLRGWIKGPRMQAAPHLLPEHAI